MSKDNWADKMKNKSSAASEFLKPFANKDEAQPPKDNNNNVNDNVIVETQPKNDPDFLDTLLEPTKKKADLVLTGIYLQPELAKVLDMLGKKGGRGAKSRIVNDALKKLFTEKGLL